MKKTDSSNSKLTLLQAAEKNRQRVESHLLQTSGDLKSVLHELQTYLAELEFQNEELRQASVERSRSHQKFHQLFEHAPVGYCLFSKIGIVLEANCACCRLLGLDRDQVVGRSFGRFVHPESQERFFNHLAGASGSGAKNGIELQIMAEGMKTRHVLMESVAQHDHPDRINTVIVDAVKRPSFDTLHTSEEKYRLLFNEMVSGAVIVDVHWDESGQPADGLVLDVNPAFERMTGIKREAAVGKRILEIFPHNESYWFEALADTARCGKPAKIEAYHRGSHKYVALQAFRLKQGHVVITGMDISEGKKKERDQLQVKDELEIKIEARTAKLEDSVDALVKHIEKRGQAEKDLMQANEVLKGRMAQLSRLAGDLILSEQRERRRLARILNTVLQENLVSVRMRLGIIQDEVPGADIGYEMEKVDSLLDESIQVTRSLSENISLPALEHEGLRAWLQWLARWMQEKHKLAVDLRVEGEYRLPRHVLVMLLESVRELLFNVLKHAEVSRALVRVQPAEGAVRISVLDKGVGFDANRIYASARKSRGLGLIHIRSRVHLLGGRFTIRSKPARGSCFSIVVPCAALPGEESSEAYRARAHQPA